jgi:hypothetical protein
VEKAWLVKFCSQMRAWLVVKSPVFQLVNDLTYNWGCLQIIVFANVKPFICSFICLTPPHTQPYTTAGNGRLPSSSHATNAVASSKHKLEPSWKTDKRMNPAYAAAGDTHHQSPPKKHKLEPSWKSDKRINAKAIAEANNGYQQHDFHESTEEDNHLGISSSRFDSLDPSEKIEELSLEVQLWKGRYDMTAKKLHRLEQMFENAGAAGTGMEGLKDHEVHALMYEGLDVEAVNRDPASLTSQDDGNELYDPYKTDVFDHSEETYGVDEHLLKILRAAGVEIDEELAAILPTWEDIVSMYGDRPIVSGLETCEAYRENVRPEDRMTGPAGMFNTGTNLLFELLKVNCDIKEARLKPRREPKHNGMRWQAPVSIVHVRVGLK